MEGFTLLILTNNYIFILYILMETFLLYWITHHKKLNIQYL